MKSLKEIQDEFQRGILAGDDAILADVNDSAKEERKVLFGVYRNAYVARLAEILGEDYEQVHAYLGDRGFANLVKAYIAANPSDQRSARWFGRHMPSFIAKSATFAKHPEVAELASLEKALADAFDGPDAEPLRLAELADIPPEAWPGLVLQPHPTAIRLTFATNAAELWTALKNEAPPVKPVEAAGTASDPCLARRLHGALQAALDRGSHDVGRGRQGRALQRAVRDGGDLRRRGRGRASRRLLPQGLGRHGDAGEPCGAPSAPTDRSR